MRYHKIVSVLLATLAAFAPAEVRVAGAQELHEQDGGQLYRRFCASCHGGKGFGDGPVASMLNVMVPDLTRIALRHGGRFPEEQVRKIIDGRTVMPPHGSRDMPVWGFEFRLIEAEHVDAQKRTQAMVRRLTDYVRSIQRPAPEKRSNEQ